MIRWRATALVLWAAFLSLTIIINAFSIGSTFNNQGKISPWSRTAEGSEGSISWTDCLQHSPREWMEHLEQIEGRQGAYTVLRCDYSKQTSKLWGQDFHLQRLVESYCALEAIDHINDENLQSAITTTNAILDALVEQTSLVLDTCSSDDGMCTVMLTILWQRDLTEPSSIVVRGHAFCDCKRFNDDQIPEPITACLALSFGDELPNRFNHLPEAKLSSWCRRRSPLEQTFKVEGVGEVLLTKRVGNEVHILEGLTSNVFVVYPDNTLRTARNDVLKGYARQLVLECPSKLGLAYDSTPIQIQDSSLWQQVFVTSSVRLVVPVQEILIPDEQGEFRPLWSAKEEDFSICMQIYKEIMHSTPC